MFFYGIIYLPKSFKLKVSMLVKKFSIFSTLIPIVALAFIISSFLGSCVNSDIFIPKAKRGVLDLSFWDFSSSSPIALDGEWELYMGELFSPFDFENEKHVEPLYVLLPDSGLWSSVYGCATWRLVFSMPKGETELSLRLPEIFSSSRVFLNGSEIFSAGVPGKTAAQTRPSYRTGVVRLDIVEGENEFIIQAANFSERRGGINRSFWLGSERSIQVSFVRSLAMDLIVFGALIIIGLYHLCLYWLRKKDRSPLWFGIFCIIIAIRSLIYGERFAFELFSGVPWEVFNRIDHLTFYIGIPVFSAYLTIIFEREVARIPMYVYQALGLVFSLFLFFPPSVFNVTVTWYEIITAFYVLYFLFVIIRALIRRTEGALTTMIGLAVFLCFGINEILFNMGIINTFNSLSIGLVLFLFTQSVLIAMRFSKAFDESETLGTSLFNMNASLRRFIPQEFFMLLQRTEVDDIRLGDQVEKKMSVMFADIRSFTSISEDLGAAKTFSFLNDYYGRVGEVIRAHGGFIDKYLGDGFIALFPTSPDAALKTAIGIQRVITLFNESRRLESLQPIDVGIGLNFGSLVLGTVGEEHRMDTTVIADSVNLSSRLESLTKQYGKGVIVPFSFLDLLENPYAYHWRYLGLIRVHGRKQPVEIVHIYDGLSKEDFTLFDSTKDRFEEALHEYRNGDYEKAMQSFRTLAIDSPNDPAVFTFITQIHRLMVSGLAGDWDGVDSPAK